MAPRRKATTLLVVVFVVYGLLVATHLGEFWPFTIYPMFSQGGKPWSRAVVREVETPPDAVSWDDLPYAGLPGTPFSATDHGFDHTDLANFVSKTERWDTDRVEGLRRQFDLGARTLLVLRARGEITEDDSVDVTFRPYAYLTADTTLLHPGLPR